VARNDVCSDARLSRALDALRQTQTSGELVVLETSALLIGETKRSPAADEGGFGHRASRFQDLAFVSHSLRRKRP
jgi:hypothetical protein